MNIRYPIYEGVYRILTIVHTPHLKQAVIQGLDGYIIAEKEGTLLICKLAEEQRIKEFSKA